MSALVGRSAARSSGVAPATGTLDARLAALARAVELGRGVVDEANLTPAREITDRAGVRIGLGVDRTVVALGGATGSGKSSLFNALAGGPLSAVGVRRPTTSTTAAATWGVDDTSPLLDWLDVRTRHHRGTGDAELDGMVLLDLPDHDSTALDHRLEVDRLVALVDLVVWVLDPQKYADAAVHERYLRPLSGHGDVLLVALNHADRLTGPALGSCLADLRRLLAADGLPEVPLVATSAATGSGLDVLHDTLAARVSQHRAAVDRLTADVAGSAARLEGSCGGDAASKPVRQRARVGLVDALAEAANVEPVASAVAASYRGRARAATGWPVTRWVGRLRPDPLRRLRISREGGSDLTSLPPATAVQKARAATAVRAVADEVGTGLPGPWADAVRQEALERAGRLPDRLDSAVAGTGVDPGPDPRWWRPFGVAQLALVAVALAGALWLALLFGLAYVQIDLEPPQVGPIAWPTLLLIGGLLLGALLSAVAGRLAAVGAARRQRRARRRLRSAVSAVAERELLDPVDALRARHAEFCTAVRTAAAR